MKKIKELYDDIMELTGEITKDHVGAYAAQTAFFLYALHDPDYIVVTDYGAIYARHKG